MTEHKTFPGKVYTVSCAEDTTVVLPDPLGVKEAVVLECTAGQQLHVTATAGRLETSSDQAIVTEVFKAAPGANVPLGAIKDALKAASEATEAAADVTEAVQKFEGTANVNENNSFTGTNTFNGVLAANGGITGLPQPTSASDAISRDGGFLSAVFSEIQRARLSPSLSKISGEATVTTDGILARKKSLTSAQTEETGITQATLFGSGGYHYFSAAWLEFKQNFADPGGRWRVVLDLSSQNLQYQTSDFSRPSLRISSVLANNRTNQFAYVEITAEVRTSANGTANGADLTLRGMNVKGTAFQGMREIRSSLPHNGTYPLTGDWNHQGIRGLFLQPTGDGCRVYLVPDSGSYRPFYVGTVQLSSQLYYDIRILLMAENTDLKLGDLSVWRGTVSDYATGIIGATTLELSTSDLSLNQLEELYPDNFES